MGYGRATSHMQSYFDVFQKVCWKLKKWSCHKLLCLLGNPTVLIILKPNPTVKHGGGGSIKLRVKLEINFLLPPWQCQYYMLFCVTLYHCIICFPFLLLVARLQVEWFGGTTVNTLTDVIRSRKWDHEIFKFTTKIFIVCNPTPEKIRAS